MRSHSTSVPAGFVAVVRENVQAYGNRRTFTFVSEDKGPGRRYRETELGFADLDRQARAIARRLHALGMQDQTVMLLYPEGLEFLKAFLGCLYARAVAVPAPFPDLDASRAERTRRVIADAGVTWVLTDAAHREVLQKWLADAGLAARVGCLDTETDTGVHLGEWRMPDIGPDTLAFLQYTSGSTSDPRGVMVSHGNLLHNAEEIKRRIRGGPGTVGVGWVPHHHDMGLIGQFLQPLYLGCRYVFTSPITFIKRPVLWLELITRHRGTIMLGPNFGYELCLRRVTDQQLEGLDLTSLRTAKNGAEPVRAATLERMAERFGHVGFRPEIWMPCYGLAESTLLVSAVPVDRSPVVRDFDAEALTRGAAVEASEPGKPGDGVRRRLVSNGQPITLRVRIVDPETRAVLPDEHVGEIWVGGGSIAQGYWRRPEQTREVFAARAADGTGPYLRTGDLGFRSRDELYVTGRIKDLIIVNGRNIYAADLEETAQAAHPAARNSAAFSIATNAGTEQVVIVQEVNPGAAGAPLAELARLTRERVARAFGLPALSVVLSGRGAVRRTTSGKIQRGLTRQAFLDRKINELATDLEPAVARLRPPAT